MRRRNFIKCCLGVLGIGTVGLAKVKAETIPTPPPKAGDVYLLRGEDISDLFPDEIVAITTFQGRFIVACKHSIWEIEENCHNAVVLQRKLLKMM